MKLYQVFMVVKLVLYYTATLNVAKLFWNVVVVSCFDGLFEISYLQVLVVSFVKLFFGEYSHGFVGMDDDDKAHYYAGSMVFEIFRIVILLVFILLY